MTEHTAKVINRICYLKNAAAKIKVSSNLTNPVFLTEKAWVYKPVNEPV